jgi:excisionase family DNA binding protein
VRLPDPTDRPWLTVAEVAAITGEGEKAIRAALDAGHLPLLRVGRYVRIPTARLRQLLGIDPSGADTQRQALTPVTPLRPVSGL